VLPWHTTPRGTFSTAHETPAVADGRISFVKGWFQNTLPDFLARGEAAYRAPVLVHYDADLYSSTQFILSLLWGHVPDYYFVFDEFMEHELVALYDFSRAFTVEIELVAQTNVGGHPAQTFGHIRRIPFTLPSAA
jgi:hypothetical protein